MKAIEVGAALVVTAFGLLLLAGYMVNERMIGFSVTRDGTGRIGYEQF
jgi:hypothetical protein